MKNGIRNFFLILFILSAAISLLLFTKQVRDAVLQAFSLSVSTVIPGLFPFLVLSDFACNAITVQTDKKFNRIIHRLFGIPAAGIPAVIFGLTGGYLTGCKTALALYDNGQITKKEAQKLCCFCFSPGLAFAIGAVGNGLFGNNKIGFLLFSCCTLSAILLGLFPKKDEDPRLSTPVIKNNIPLSHIFTLSVSKGAQACLQLTAWMAIFASLQAILFAVLPTRAHAGLSLLFEVTTGAVQCVKRADLPLCGAVLGFGGLCIFFQLLPDLQKAGLSAVRFLRFRLLQAVLSMVFCKIILFLFPDFGIAQNVVMIKTYSINPTASFFFLFACFIFILDLAPPKKMCYYIKEYTENKKN
ncbi:MAG: hypothetical protein E7523_09940 [Ruminococcaceae bacterium]|nr:hypothetical protein [Oscillospiraceae bacterium]